MWVERWLTPWHNGPTRANGTGDAGGSTVPPGARHAVGGIVPVVDLGSPEAGRSLGAKAANLARALRAGLPVLPGFAITGDGAAVLAEPASGQRAATLAAVHEAWARLSGDGRRALVVRSSANAEDGAVSSMAGR